MSTCPEKDIHSIYLDNELPPVYIAEYEAHLNQCPKCRAELSQMKALQESLRADSKSLDFSQKDLDESFERLNVRMSYAKVANNKNVHSFSISKWTAGAAAAALIFAVVLPLRIKNTTAMPENENESEIAAKEEFESIKMPKIPQAAIPNTHLTSLISSEQNTLSHTASFAAKDEQESLRTIQDSLTSVDVFRPNFPDKPLSIKITLSPFADMNNTESIQKVPVIIEYCGENEMQGFGN